MTGLLQDYVARQVERRPEAAAIVMSGETLSYGELGARSDRLARALCESGLEPGDRVCLLIPKSANAIVAMLGTLKAGGTYVPVDPASPPSRLARVLRAADPRLLLAAGPVGSTLQAALSELSQPERPLIGSLEADGADLAGLEMAFTLSDVESLPADPPRRLRRPSDPAHILFTSGSTGQPKGVVITHSNVTRFVNWAVKHFDMLPSDRVSGHSPLHFDLSTYDIFGAFAAGATLYPVPPELNLVAPRLVAFIRDSRLTQWFSVPSILSYVASFEAVPHGAFPELKRLMWCGEVFPTPQLRYWMERCPQVSFTNLYGPTETTIASSYYHVAERPESDSEILPIGRACAGEELLVLDDEQQRSRVDAVGKLYIGGVGLSPGYWRDPETTARVFGPHPDDPSQRIYDSGDLASVRHDGMVVFRGRADSQIKSRGYRIELGEIETALHTISQLDEGAIVAIETSGFEGYSICCAYVPSEGSEVSPAVLRSALAEAVPSYMLPGRWLELDRLPHNANGKVDRPALRAAFRSDA